jgi:hypothetical protein
VICESCLDSIRDDSMGILNESDLDQAAVEMGYMLPDHTCDSIESGDACECSGHEGAL